MKSYSNTHRNNFRQIIALVNLAYTLRPTLRPSFLSHACSPTVYTIVTAHRGRSLLEHLGLLQRNICYGMASVFCSSGTSLEYSVAPTKTDIYIFFCTLI